MHTYQVPKVIMPANEEFRLQKLHAYEILDTPAEMGFNRLAQMAADIFDVPSAAIAFVSETDIFLKAQIGAKLETKRNKSLFALSILANEFLVIDNDHQLAKPTDFNTYEFFVSANILSPDGYALGAIAVYDSQQNSASQHQLKMLKYLAEMVSEMIENRLSIRKTFRAQDDRLHVLIHDLKNPMTTISLQSELVSRIPNIDEKTVSIATKINNQSKRIVENLNEILSSARKENGSFKPQKTKVDLRVVLANAIESLKLTYELKKQTFHINTTSAVEIYGDEGKLKELFLPLLHNAIKFSGVGKIINVNYNITDNSVKISIVDNGVGLTANDLERLFIKFSLLSATPTQNENSNGLGLIVAKMFTDIHKGKLWAESKGINKGTTFHVELPIK